MKAPYPTWREVNDLQRRIKVLEAENAALRSACEAALVFVESTISPTWDGDTLSKMMTVRSQLREALRKTT